MDFSDFGELSEDSQTTRNLNIHKNALQDNSALQQTLSSRQETFKSEICLFFQYVKTFLSFYSCKNEFNWIVKATTHSKLDTKIMFDLVPQKLSQLWKRRLLFSLKTIHTSRLILSALSFCQLRKGTNKGFSCCPTI